MLSPSLFCCCCFLNVTRRAPSCTLAASHLLAFFCVVWLPLQRERGFMSVSRRYGGTQSEMCFMPRLGSVCMCASKCLRSALDDGAFSNFSTHPGWLRLRVLLLPLPAVCRGHGEVGRGAGCGKLAGRQNLRGNKTTVCVYKHTRSAFGLATTLRLQGTKRSVSARSAAGLSCWSPNARTEPCGQDRDYCYCWSRCW